MEKIFDVRFIVPPIFTLLFVFLFSPTYFLAQYSQVKLIEIIITGPIIILGIGIIISSIVNFILVIGNFRSSKYSKEEKQILKEIFFKKENIDIENDYEKDPNTLELGSWLILSSFDEHLQGQVHKRWHWAVAGFNYCVALILAIVIILLGRYVFQVIPYENNWSSQWSFIVTLFLLIFFYNAYKNRKSVISMDRILVRNYKQIKLERENQIKTKT